MLIHTSRLYQKILQLDYISNFIFIFKEISKFLKSRCTERCSVDRTGRVNYLSQIKSYRFPGMICRQPTVRMRHKVNFSALFGGARTVTGIDVWIGFSYSGSSIDRGCLHSYIFHGNV